MNTFNTTAKSFTSVASFASFAFAVVCTLATLGAVDGLAHKPAVDAQMAAGATTAPLQVIVVTGKRAA
jgi:hypothetical protein